MANKIVNLIDGEDEIFPKIPCIYYNADTDRRVESNRADAIQHIIDTANQAEGNVHAIIRYSGGYYYGYVFVIAQTYPTRYILEIDATYTVHIWSGDGTHQVELKRTI